MLDAVSAKCTSRHILGRIDVGIVVHSNGSSSKDNIIRSLEIVIKSLTTSFKHAQDMHSAFTGVLLAGWQAYFPPCILNELIKHMNFLGLDVYLEISPPTFLSEFECRNINMEVVKGMVCRNGAILPDGNRRNFFQMADMRSALRALAAPSTGSTVMMWDTVDDEVELEHAVVKRSFNWCRFSNALSWIGPRNALTDAELAVTKSVIGEPLGAMMWLKGDNIMKVHDVWKSNDKVSSWCFFLFGLRLPLKIISH